MGYCVSQKEARFTIKAANKPAALAAIKALAGKGTHQDSSGRHYAWVEDEEYLRASTLEDALRAWLYEAKTNENGDIVGITFEAEKLGDEAILFRAIAPYVEPGSYIHMVGEDGEQWRWFFDGQEMREQEGRVRFE